MASIWAAEHAEYLCAKLAQYKVSDLQLALAEVGKDFELDGPLSVDRARHLLLRFGKGGSLASHCKKPSVPASAGNRPSTLPPVAMGRGKTEEFPYVPAAAALPRSVTLPSAAPDTDRREVTSQTSGTLKLLIAPDLHCPFHDKRAVDLVIAVGKAIKPDIIIQLGDLVDCISVSSYTRDLSVNVSLKEEIESANSVLDQFETIGAKRHIIVGSNHDVRLEKYIAEKAPALFGYCKLEDLLRLRQRGWEWCEYGDYIKVSDTCYTHDTGTAGAFAHDRARAVIGGSVVIGHTHRLAFSVTRTETGLPNIAAMFGALCSFKDIKYLHRAAVRNWVHGFGTGTILANGTTFLEPHPIIDYRCVVEGVVHEG